MDELLDIVSTLLSTHFPSYAHQNIQARIIAKALLIIYKKDCAKLEEIIQKVSENISESEVQEIGMPIRMIIYLLEEVEEESLIKSFHPCVAPIR